MPVYVLRVCDSCVLVATRPLGLHLLLALRSTLLPLKTAARRFAVPPALPPESDAEPQALPRPQAERSSDLAHTSLTLASKSECQMQLRI